MKRAFFLLILILLIEQGSKLYFQVKKINILLTNNFGFNYIINPGILINQNISNHIIIVLFTYSFLIWILTIYLLYVYHKRYRKSLIVDLSFAFYSVGILGNILDRIIFGYIRDFIVTPILICNIADLCGVISVLLFFIEFIIYPKSRELLKIK